MLESACQGHLKDYGWYEIIVLEANNSRNVYDGEEMLVHSINFMHRHAGDVNKENFQPVGRRHSKGIL